MGLFRPYERPEGDKAAPEPTPAPQGTAKPAGKGAPTPSRREAEAARRERLNPTLSPKELRQRERAAKNSLRDEQFVKVEAAPAKVLMRDFVDSRKGVAQWSMPILMGTLALSLALGSFGTEAATMVAWFTYAIFALIAIDLFLMWRGYKRLHAERLPKEPLKGMVGYMLNRAINMRRLRMPAPRVKPGDEI